VDDRQPPVDLLGAHGQVTRRPRRSVRTAVAAVVAGLALAACTGGPSGRDGDDSATEPSAGSSPVPSSPSASATTTEATRPAPPEVGACYDLGYDAATAPTSDAEPVSCAKRHTAQTYHVGRLDLDVDGHLLAVDSERAQRQVARTCPRRLNRHLGGSQEDRALSRLRAVWFSPTLQESDAGASWFRCDVVAIARPQTLAPLPRPRRVRGILDREDALSQVGLCGTAAPGANSFERVICSRRHSWRAVSTIDIDGGTAYPGAARVRRAGAESCRNLVREASGSPERFRYGWEWPTREQWRSGQRFGYCWAPD
jgi:hypothetical protein